MESAEIIRRIEGREPDAARIGGWRAATYVLLAAALQLTAFSLSRWTTVFSGSPHTGAMFMAAFLGGLISLFWPGLRPRHAFYVPAILLVCEPLLALAFQALGAGRAQIGALEFLLRGGVFGDGYFRSMVIQTAVACIIAVGLLIRRKHEGFSVRRAASHREEAENFFELFTQTRPRRPMTVFRFQSLVERSFCLAAVIENRVLGYVVPIRKNDTVFIYDLIIAPDVPDAREATASASRRTAVQLLGHLLGRLETEGAARFVAFLPAADDDEALGVQADVFLEFGFRAMDYGAGRDSDLILDARETFTDLFSERFPDWPLLAGVGRHFVLEKSN